MVTSGKIDGIRKVLANYDTIRIADYQRNYDWGRAEIDELWSDLHLAIEEKRDHFFGSLILQEIEE